MTRPVLTATRELRQNIQSERNIVKRGATSEMLPHPLPDLAAPQFTCNPLTLMCKEKRLGSDVGGVCYQTPTASAVAGVEGSL